MLLWGFATSLHTVLWIAVIPGIVAVLLLLKVPEPADTVRKTARLPLSREGLSRLGPRFWRLSMLGVLIALARFSEAFLVLRASERHVPLKFIPLVLVVMSIVYTLTAYPVGRLSDRISRTTLLALGMLALVAADAVLALANGDGLLFFGIALWGLHMGMTQGLLATLIADVSPVAYRGTAFGVFNLMSGAGLLAASALAGWLWDRHGPPATFWAGATLALIAAVWTMLARNSLAPVATDG
jgi:predicted MFS family arabinose efflux permease